MKTSILATILLFSRILIGQETKNAQIPDPGGLFMPDPVSFSFNTPGWYFLEALLFIFLSIRFFKWYKRWRSNAYRRQALDKLQSLEIKKDNQCINKTMVILRKAAIHAYGRNQAASLYGIDWLKFLESKAKHTSFTRYNKAILNFIYKNKSVDKNTRRAIIEQSKKWIKTHA